MDIKSYNKALAQQVKKALDFAFTKEVDPADEEVFFCCDTDTVKYKTIATHNRVRLIFTCVDLEHIWKYCSDHLVHKHFQSTPSWPSRLRNRSDYPIAPESPSNKH